MYQVKNYVAMKTKPNLYEQREKIKLLWYLIYVFCVVRFWFYVRLSSPYSSVQVCFKCGPTLFKNVFHVLDVFYASSSIFWLSHNLFVVSTLPILSFRTKICGGYIFTKALLMATQGNDW